MFPPIIRTWWNAASTSSKALGTRLTAHGSWLTAFSFQLSAFSRAISNTRPALIIKQIRLPPKNQFSRFDYIAFCYCVAWTIINEFVNIEWRNQITNIWSMSAGSKMLLNQSFAWYVQMLWWHNINDTRFILCERHVTCALSIPSETFFFLVFI